MTAPDAKPPRKKARRLAPDLWVSLRPNGIGLQKPNHFGEMARTIWENRHAPRYAWRILSQGVCDGCALGVAGFHDWTIDGVHLCTTRLNLLRLNTMRALDPARLADVEALRALDGAALRDLGRLPCPMLRRRGEPGFRRISWDEALALVADRVRDARTKDEADGGDRLGFFLTARGITNEVYYVAQKVARFLGTNSVDNAARICHAPSTNALKDGLGVAATTVSYSDVIESDLIVLFGSDVANAQPVFMKYLYMARKRGARIAVVNPMREPGLERYWVPSNPESAIFGTHIATDFFPVSTGGDIAFLTGVLKVLADEARVDEDFIRAHTTGWDEDRAGLAERSLADLARWSGSTVEDIVRFARMYGDAGSAVLIWSMGITQHVCGIDNVRAIVGTLALARGNIGRPGAGLMPIRGHSGVQGGAEMGAYATSLPGGISIDMASATTLSEAYGFPVRSERGRSAAEMVEAAGRGELDVLWSSGGNFLDTLPDPAAVRSALERVPLRVHVDIVVSSQMLLEGEEVLLLPAMTRYEQPGGGTETTTERRVAFSPEIEGPRVGEARAEWRIYLDLARAVDPEGAARLGCDDAQAIRDEIARVIPAYEGIQRLAKSGDAIQVGGERLCDGWRFPTHDGKAHFRPVVPREADVPDGRFILSTRRGKQFNSMVWKRRDPLTGADRDALFIAAEDAQRLGLGDGARVRVRSANGEVDAHLKVSPIRPGNVQMFFPEANPLLESGRRDPIALVPDYNAVVEIVPA